MFSRIETLRPKQLIGIHAAMSYLQDQTPALWRRFMRRCNEVARRMDTNYISMQVFPALNGQAIAPDQGFTKWATVEVAEGTKPPEGMESYQLRGGLYAVFIQRGPAAAFRKTFGYIHGTWFPQSEFEVDDREHFEVLPEGYSPIDPEAEEEIWIPIRKKSL